MGFSLTSWLHRRRVKAAVQFAGPDVQVHRVTNPYHAVSIQPGPACRGTAEKYKGKRFLSAEAPQLPLPTCDSRSCRCRYVHHNDRRTGRPRRNRDVWNKNPAIVTNDRRASAGRRVTDN